MTACKHEGHFINQGEWWCDLQFRDEKPNPIHLACDCIHCPDYEEYPEFKIFSSDNNITTIKWEKVSEI